MSGIQAGVLAFLLWGLVPLFWRLLEHHDSWELVAHRAVWSLPLLLAILIVQRRPQQALAGLKQGRLWLTSVLLACNWLLYVWLSVQGHFIEASLGYFIVPLLNTLLGVGFLGETLRPLQKAAIILAGAALLFPLADMRYFPWAALAIAALWSGYGFIRKGLGVEGIAALTTETIALLPLALGFLLWRHALPTPTRDGALLVLTGPVTVIPLLLFGYAIPRVPLTVLGLLQYIGPTITFLMGVFYFHEPVPLPRIGLLAFVWIAIGLYATDSWRNRTE